MNITYSSISDAGPRSVNEDSLDCWVTKTGETVACIADGLGGMGEGDIASHLAVKEFRDFIDSNGVKKETLLAGAFSAHHDIRNAQSSDGNRNGMASTLTAVVLSESEINGVHCGDSRAVIARGNGIKRLTKDHSEGQMLFDAGKLTKSEFANYERKHILVSALGDKNDPVIDEFKFDLQSGDRVLLTTDGVHNIVLLRQMKNFVVSSSTPSELVRRVSFSVNEYGPTDNFSMLALYIQ